MADENSTKKDGVSETELHQHKQIKKELVPPLNTIGMTTSSWLNHRMPEMIWAVLVVGNLTREGALDFFRYVGNYVGNHKECWDITITGISSLPAEQKLALLTTMVNYSEEVNALIKSLLIFPEFPLLKELKTIYAIEEPSTLKPEELDVMISNLATGVKEVLWHQSDPATDCRWVKLLCRVTGGKARFSSTIEGIEETLKGLDQYPNYGDLTHIRPFIRASEIVPFAEERPDSLAWANHFWDFCYKNTDCVRKNEPDVFEEKVESWEKQSEHYFQETIRARMSLIKHFFDTSTTTTIDAKHEGAFGLSFYALTLLSEIVLYRINYSITAKLTIRAVVEAYITFGYLVVLNDDEEWKKFRGYGSGQAKLVYLKLKDILDKPKSIAEDKMREIANEDVWQEFVNINLGHWGTTNLRDMSEKAGLKDVYDLYYSYTSGFVHGNWAAIRESVYEKCFNPLHRLHRSPTKDFPISNPTIEDTIDIVNKVFKLLHSLYPDFTEEINLSK